MKVTHAAVTSSVFSLVKLLEVDLSGGDDSWTERIEIWEDTEDSTRFRCRFWQSEPFRLTPSFPRNEQGQPAHHTDDILLVERNFTGQTVTLEPFPAANVDAAVAIALGDLKRFIEHTTKEPVQ